MASELTGTRVAFLTANEGVEQAELTDPWQAVKDAGGTPELIAPETGEVQAFNHVDKADTFTVHRTLRDADPGDYSALVLPGGVAVACSPMARSTSSTVRARERSTSLRLWPARNMWWCESYRPGSSVRPYRLRVTVPGPAQRAGVRR